MVHFFKLSLIVLLFWGKPENTPVSKAPVQDSTSLIQYPAHVMAVIDAKCMGCHKPDSKNEKGKAKLTWESLQRIESDSLSRQLDAILIALEEGSMPPKKALEMRPERKLTDEEVKTLTEWAESSLAGLKD